MQTQNIPTDLLRTLIAVVDLRSFTKAAQMLGVTQPAVSAQIKRLQSLIGYELLDKSAPGVSLTQRGTTVVAQARRLLAINDEILQVTNGHSHIQTLRVGIPGDYSGSRIPATLAVEDISYVTLASPDKRTVNTYTDLYMRELLGDYRRESFLSNQYFVLDDTGTIIWSSVKTPWNENQLREILSILRNRSH